MIHAPDGTIGIRLHAETGGADQADYTLAGLAVLIRHGVIPVAL
jgi:hypothetical protein